MACDQNIIHILAFSSGCAISQLDLRWRDHDHAKRNYFPASITLIQTLTLPSPPRYVLSCSARDSRSSTMQDGIAVFSGWICAVIDRCLFERRDSVDGSGTEGVIAKIEAFAHQEFNNDGTVATSCCCKCTFKCIFESSVFISSSTFTYRIQVQGSNHQGASLPPTISTAVSRQISHISNKALDNGIDYFHTGEDTRLGGLTRNM